MLIGARRHIDGKKKKMNSLAFRFDRIPSTWMYILLVFGKELFGELLAV